MSATFALPAGIFQPAIRSPERWERALARREVFSLDATRELALSCVDGVLWVTLAGDPRDHVLTPGEGMHLARGAQATIQAIRAGRFGVGRG